jgi:hypothetical protein
MQVYGPLYEGAYPYGHGGLSDLRPLQMVFPAGHVEGREGCEVYLDYQSVVEPIEIPWQSFGELMFPPKRIVCLTEETVKTLDLLGEQNRIVGISRNVRLKF